jgi:hypothetical protein
MIYLDLKKKRVCIEIQDSDRGQILPIKKYKEDKLMMSTACMPSPKRHQIIMLHQLPCGEKQAMLNACISLP